MLPSGDVEYTQRTSNLRRAQYREHVRRAQRSLQQGLQTLSRDLVAFLVSSTTRSNALASPLRSTASTLGGTVALTGSTMNNNNTMLRKLDSTVATLQFSRTSVGGTNDDDDDESPLDRDMTQLVNSTMHAAIESAFATLIDKAPDIDAVEAYDKDALLQRIALLREECHELRQQLQRHRDQFDTVSRKYGRLRTFTRAMRVSLWETLCAVCAEIERRYEPSSPDAAAALSAVRRMSLQWPADDDDLSAAAGGEGSVDEQQKQLSLLRLSPTRATAETDDDAIAARIAEHVTVVRREEEAKRASLEASLAALEASVPVRIQDAVIAATNAAVSDAKLFSLVKVEYERRIDELTEVIETIRSDASQRVANAKTALDKAQSVSVAVNSTVSSALKMCDPAFVATLEKTCAALERDLAGANLRLESVREELLTTKITSRKEIHSLNQHLREANTKLAKVRPEPVIIAEAQAPLLKQIEAMHLERTQLLRQLADSNGKLHDTAAELSTVNAEAARLRSAATLAADEKNTLRLRLERAEAALGLHESDHSNSASASVTNVAAAGGHGTTRSARSSFAVQSATSPSARRSLNSSTTDDPSHGHADIHSARKGVSIVTRKRGSSMATALSPAASLAVSPRTQSPTAAAAAASAVDANEGGFASGAVSGAVSPIATVTIPTLSSSAFCAAIPVISVQADYCASPAAVLRATVGTQTVIERRGTLEMNVISSGSGAIGAATSDAFSGSTLVLSPTKPSPSQQSSASRSSRPDSGRVLRDVVASRGGSSAVFVTTDDAAAAAKASLSLFGSPSEALVVRPFSSPRRPPLSSSLSTSDAAKRVVVSNNNNSPSTVLEASPQQQHQPERMSSKSLTPMDLVRLIVAVGRDVTNTTAIEDPQYVAKTRKRCDMLNVLGFVHDATCQTDDVVVTTLSSENAGMQQQQQQQQQEEERQSEDDPSVEHRDNNNRRTTASKKEEWERWVTAVLACTCLCDVHRGELSDMLAVASERKAAAGEATTMLRPPSGRRGKESASLEIVSNECARTTATPSNIASVARHSARIRKHGHFGSAAERLQRGPPSVPQQHGVSVRQLSLVPARFFSEAATTE